MKLLVFRFCRITSKTFLHETDTVRVIHSGAVSSFNLFLGAQLLLPFWLSFIPVEVQQGHNTTKKRCLPLSTAVRRKEHSGQSCKMFPKRILLAPPSAIAERTENRYVQMHAEPTWQRTTGDGFRRGAVTGRTRFQRSDGDYQKRNERTGEFMEAKSGGDPFKGRRERAGRSGHAERLSKTVSKQIRDFGRVFTRDLAAPPGS